MDISSYLNEALLNHILLGTVYTPPADVYMGLCTTNPTPENLAGSEVNVASDTGYARQLMTFNTPAQKSIQTPTNNHQNAFCENSTVISFAAFTGVATDYDVEYFAIYDALTANNLLFYTKTASPITRVNGGATLDIALYDIRLFFA